MVAPPSVIGLDAYRGTWVAYRAPGRQSYEQHAPSVRHHYAPVYREAAAGLYGLYRRFLDRAPELDDVGVGIAPLLDNLLLLAFAQSHTAASHVLQSVDASAIAKCQDGDFTLRPQVAVLAVLLYGTVEHLARRRAVYVAA